MCRRRAVLASVVARNRGTMKVPPRSVQQRQSEPGYSFLLRARMWLSASSKRNKRGGTGSRTHAARYIERLYDL